MMKDMIEAIEEGNPMTFRDRIHPQLRAWYDASGGFDFDHLEEFRARCNAAELANLKEDPLVSVRDEMIPGPEDAPEVKVRIYEPANRDDTPLPCLFFYHGGGFLFGTVYRQENLCQRYVKNAGCVVVSVEYRLAPQWKAPAQLLDCYAALTWVHDNAKALRVDPDRLAVSGLSAVDRAMRANVRDTLLAVGLTAPNATDAMKRDNIRNLLFI